MARNKRPRGEVLLALIAATSLAAEAGHAACPENTCDCLADAGRYAIVGTKRAVIAFNARVGGDSCAPSILVRSYNDFLIQVTRTRSLFATESNPRKIGVGFRRDQETDIFVGGDVVTGGSLVRGTAGVIITGTVDTTGAHAEIPRCEQAVIDAQVASAMLSTLPPTRDLGALKLVGDDLTLVADDGVNVWTASEIDLLPRPGYYPALWIQLAPGTDAVIINAGRVRMGKGRSAPAAILVNGGDGRKVIVNVPGTGPAIRVKGYSDFDPVLLAPERVLRLTGFVRQAVIGRIVQYRGADLSSFSACPDSGSPSGAFIDRPSDLAS